MSQAALTFIGVGGLLLCLIVLFIVADRATKASYLGYRELRNLYLIVSVCLAGGALVSGTILQWGKSLPYIVLILGVMIVLFLAVGSVMLLLVDQSITDEMVAAKLRSERAQRAKDDAQRTADALAAERLRSGGAASRRSEVPSISGLPEVVDSGHPSYGRAPE
jgi:hypothetical protein